MQNKKRNQLLCVLLVLAIMVSSFGSGTLGVAAAELEFDIGKNEGSVTATLADDGTLTIQGAGEIRDFTAETAPFAGKNVQQVEIGVGITGIGAYTFYNCAGISGFLTLPKGIVRIGERAFSASDAENAPRPTFVQNNFTESLVVSVNEETSAGSAEEEPSTEGDAVDTELSEAQTLANSAPEESTEGEESEITSVEDAADESAVEPTSEPAPEATPEPTEQPTAEPTPLPESSAVTEPEETDEPKQEYTVTKVTQQEIGTEIFYPGSGGMYSCSEANESFAAAMTAAGYTRADGVAQATFHCGEGTSSGDVQLTLPVAGGSVILPNVPAEFTAPEETDLCSYSFAGWTEQKDPAGTVRAPGSSFATGERTDLYFIANWQKTPKIELSFSREGDVATYALPALENYEITEICWQTRLGSGAWEELPNETGATLVYSLQPGDSKREFRCVITVTEKLSVISGLFTEAKTEQLQLNAIGSGLTELEATLALAKGTGLKTAEVTLLLPVTEENSTYRITAVTLPQGMQFVQNERDLTANGDTALLYLRPTGSSWNTNTAQAQLVTENPNGDTWASGVPNVLRNDGDATTGATDVAEMTVSLTYDSGYTALTDGTVTVTLEETIGEESRSMVTVSLAMEDITYVKQTVTSAAGRAFTGLTSGKKEIPLSCAISALFVTEYYPVEETADNIVLSLYQGENEISLPVGAQIVLADQSAEPYRYYTTTLTTATKGMKLSDLNYLGTGKSNVRVTEQLLVVLSLEVATGLNTGEYSLRLSHVLQPGAVSPTEKAEFTLTAKETEAGLSAWLNADVTEQNRWCVDLNAEHPENYWLYAVLYGADGNAVQLPQKTQVEGADSVNRCENGGLQIVPASSRLVFDLTAALPGALTSGEYRLCLQSGVRPGLQNGGETTLTPNVEFEVTYTEPEEDSAAVRSLSVKADTRVLDAEQGEIMWQLNLGYGGEAEGDTMRLTVLKKVVTEPREDSYVAESSISGYNGALTGSVTLTIPQGQAAGTYRALVEILDANGTMVAQEPYNFIVK